MTRSRTSRPAARTVGLLTLGLSLLCGCSSPQRYLLEQAWGQLRILHHRKPISEVLQRRDLPPDWRFKLEAVLLARRFGHEELGLPLSAAYTEFYDTGGKPLAYNLSACPPDSLQPKLWRFPIVGRLPYIGFFERQRALAEQRRCEHEGYETYLYEVPAFSSLGWFADPVYSPLLEEDLARLIDVVLHETAHNAVFLRDQVAFNESFATFVGNQGTLDFLARLYGPAAAEVRDYAARLVRRQQLAKLVSELYERLNELYRSPVSRAHKLTEREQLFEWARRRYKTLFPDPTHWGAFVREPLNNAVLLGYGRYNQGLEFHRAAYEALGRDLRRMVTVYRAAQRFDEPVTYIARICHIPAPRGQRM